MTDSVFSASEWLRYTRHLQMPQVGVKGQQRLKNSHVLIVGAGGLGCPVSLYLAAAGIGHITIIDGDTVDLTNLQRQIVFTTDQIGQSKAECVKQRLLALNPEIHVESVVSHLTIDNADALVQQADLILDCTDNFSTRYLINDTCIRLKKPWLFASIYQFSGQCALFTPASACFRCLFPDKPTEVADCNTAGVLGVLPGLLGTLQANEAIKYLVGLPCPLENTLLIVEATDLTFKHIQLQKNIACTVCGEKVKGIDITDYQFTCATDLTEEHEVSSEQFNVAKGKPEFILLDVRTLEERQAFNIGGEHIPLSNISDEMGVLNKNKTILCYCQTGIRSKKAVTALVAAGFSAKSLQGGLSLWLKGETSK